MRHLTRAARVTLAMLPYVAILVLDFRREWGITWDGAR
jgi:hypothetical protein